MPHQNCFAHQTYPATPSLKPSFHSLTVQDGAATNFAKLHSDLAVRDVVIVHGTFMGKDSFAVAEILGAIGKSIPVLSQPLANAAEKLRQHLKPAVDQLTGDVANYTAEFREQFQNLVGDDPRVILLDPPWSGQNHHFARADLAVRLLCHLDELQPTSVERVLLWGHSHAGNGFALLSNLLANHRDSVERFFEAAGTELPDHWIRAREILRGAVSPHPYSRSVLIAAFGTPVRYGWDSQGYRSLLHILHHRNYDTANPTLTKPLFPPHGLKDTLSAHYGDWVQAFAIAGTDVPPPTALAVNKAFTELLESNLPEPEHDLDTRFIVPKRVRDACRRWKEGTRCHADGQNLLVEYQPSGRRTSIGNPVEDVILGHGVATTVDWLPAHLTLVMKALAEDQQG